MNSGFAILDIAIGLILVFLILSFLCSSANEGLESFFKNRSRLLERGLRELLEDAQSGTLTQKIYDHPLINSLFVGNYTDAKKNRTLPSYIPATNFAMALLGTILPPKATEAGGTAGTLLSGPAAISAAQMNALRVAVVNCPFTKIQPALLALMDACGNDVNQLRNAIEGWFNSSMDRVSGWYKRRTQLSIFIIALVMSGTLNVDAIDVANHLASDPALRSSLVATAQQYVNSASAQQDLHQRPDIRTLEGLGIPIGWAQQTAPKTSYKWFLKITGLLASALAASLGAPFWFDLLNRFIVIRSTVKPAEKSSPEKSKD